MDHRYADDLSVIQAVRSASRVFGVAVCALVLAACGQPVPQETVAPPAELCLNDFQNCVMPVLSGQIRRSGGGFVSCMDGNCHAAGGNGGRFTLGADSTANFTAVTSSFVNFASAGDSPLLAKPAQDNVPHGGGDILRPSPPDPCYQAIDTWIRNQNQSVSACGVCSSVGIPAACGF